MKTIKKLFLFFLVISLTTPSFTYSMDEDESCSTDEDSGLTNISDLFIFQLIVKNLKCGSDLSVCARTCRSLNEAVQKIPAQELDFNIVNAAQHGNVHFVQKFINEDLFNEELANKAFWLAVDNGYNEVFLIFSYNKRIRDLINNVSIVNRTLCRAAFYGHNAIVEIILSNQGICNLIGEDSVNYSFYWAVRNCHNKVVAILLDNERICSLIREKKAKNALFYAAINRHDEMVTILRANLKIRELCGIINFNLCTIL